MSPKKPKTGPVKTKDGTLYNYIVVVDAGSSGSRVHIYHYPEKSKHRIPEVNKSGNQWIEKVKPGISTFADDPKHVGKKHLKKLLKYAEKVVPKDQQERTPIFLHATAGMRLLEDEERESILQNACEYIQHKTCFYLPDCKSHLNVIEGEVEGIFGWLGLNYLIGGIDEPEKHNHGKNHSTYGFMDMGGASTQITFVPNATEVDKHSHRLYKVTLASTDGKNDATYDIYSKSFLGSGVREARDRYLDRLDKGSDGIYKDPCMPRGYKTHVPELDKRSLAARPQTPKSRLVERANEELSAQQNERFSFFSRKEEKTSLSSRDKHDDDSDSSDSDSDSDEDDDDDEKDHSEKKPEKEEANLEGSGNFEACSKSIMPLLDDIKNQTKPGFDFDVNHFVAVSEYWDLADGFEMGGKFDYNELSKKVKDFCESDWIVIENNGKEFGKFSRKDLEMLCFKANWMLGVISEGYSFPSVKDREDKEPEGSLSEFMHPLQTAEEVNGVQFSWTLGRALLYASAELSPNGSSTGIQLDGKLTYGAEVDGNPRPDFNPSKDHDHDDNDDDGYDLDDILSHKPHRLWGSLVFLGILFFIVYLLLGRVRRRQIWETVRTKVFRSRPRYRPVEEQRAHDAEDYELREVEDDFDIEDDDSDIENQTSKPL
ncbi:hypothetical protein TRICI_000516 [Trichomonascus ciferrii]|uniref:Golgi apyrase n=1 Tax=Trichomonascus ciferrii TaxID=44093 RepID=A0A642VD64_9ASCO|nr:hypothetical protein TRICI_000516 [Trichomonascus ciferrii]